MKKPADIRNTVLAGMQARRQGTAPSEAPAQRQTAYVANFGRQLNDGLKDKIAKLEEERAAGGVVLKIDPKRIAPSEFANRHALSLAAGDPDLESLKAGIRDMGQLEPIRVRIAAPDSGFDYELVYGHRRHAATLALDAETEGGFPVLALLDSAAAETRDLVLKMYSENAARKDLSAFEQGHMFRSWLDAEVFATQGELAAAVGLSDATVSQYLAADELPKALIAAFGDPRAIAMRWMQNLSKALKADRAAVLETAGRLAKADPRPSPEQVYQALSGAPTAGRKPSSTREESVKIQGKVALKLSRRDGRLLFKLGRMVDKGMQKELAEELKEYAATWLTKRFKGRS